VPASVPFGRLSKTLGLDVVARRAVFDEPIGELADRGSTVVLTHELADRKAMEQLVCNP